MSRIGTIRMTARQFLELGEDPPGVRLELVDGEVAVSPSAIPEHAHVVVKLTRLLDEHVEQHARGRVYADLDVVLGEYHVRRPDVIFLSRDRLHLVGEKAIEGPPNLCVEVLSPTSVELDPVEKFDLYQSCGIEHYWIIDPQARRIEAYLLARGRYIQAAEGAGDTTVRLAPFPELTLPLGKLWQPPWPAS